MEIVLAYVQRTLMVRQADRLKDLYDKRYQAALQGADENTLHSFDSDIHGLEDELTSWEYEQIGERDINEPAVAPPPDLSMAKGPHKPPVTEIGLPVNRSLREWVSADRGKGFNVPVRFIKPGHFGEDRTKKPKRGNFVDRLAAGI